MSERYAVGGRRPEGQSPSASKNDPVHSPGHYRGRGLEAIDLIEDWALGMHLGNAVKYILRAGKKGEEIEDLEKARWYLRRAVNAGGHAPQRVTGRGAHRQCAAVAAVKFSIEPPLGLALAQIEQATFETDDYLAGLAVLRAIYFINDRIADLACFGASDTPTARRPDAPGAGGRRPEGQSPSARNALS